MNTPTDTMSNPCRANIAGDPKVCAALHVHITNRLSRNHCEARSEEQYDHSEIAKENAQHPSLRHFK